MSTEPAADTPPSAIVPPTPEAPPDPPPKKPIPSTNKEANATLAEMARLRRNARKACELREGTTKKKLAKVRKKWKRADGRDDWGDGTLIHGRVPISFGGRAVEAAELTQLMWSMYHGAVDASVEELYCREQMRHSKIALRRFEEFGEPVDEVKADKWLVKLKHAERRVLRWHGQMMLWQDRKIAFTRHFVMLLRLFFKMEKRFLKRQIEEGGPPQGEPPELDAATQRILKEAEKEAKELSVEAPPEFEDPDYDEDDIIMDQNDGRD